MNNCQLDKLAQIKIKYGYTSKNNRPTTDNRYYSHLITNSQQEEIFQQIQIPHNYDRTASPNPSQLNNYQTQPRSTSLYRKDSKIQTKPTFETKLEPSFPQTQINKSPKSYETNSKNQYYTNKQPQIEMNPMQKTYDLLKNYRMKIRNGLETAQTDQTEKKLKIRENKENETTQEKQQIKQLTKKLNPTTLVESKYELTPKSQTHKQPSTPIQTLNRRSPLDSLPQSHNVDIKQQLNNLEKLQLKIKSVLGHRRLP